MPLSRILFFVIAGASASGDTPLPLPGTELRASIAGEASHRYVVDAAKDTALSATVLQEGIDLVVEVRDASDALLLRVDSPNGANGPERAEWVSGDGGRFSVVVRPLVAKSAGSYRLSTTAPRPATSQDRDLMAARREIARAYERRDAFDYGPAREAGERALQLMTSAAGAEAIETGDAYDLLGYVYDEIGLFDRGALMFATALTIRQKADASDSIRNGTEANLAWLELGAGRYADAERRFRSVAARRLAAGEVVGAENALTGQGAALSRLGRDAEAEVVLRGVVAREEKRLGPNATALDYMLRHLALALVGAGRASEGEAMCTRALALPRADLWGEMGRGYDLRCVGTALSAQGRFAEAEKLFGESLAICTKQRGASSLCAADTLEQQALNARAAGDVARSRSAFEAALRIRSAVLPQSHPQVVDLQRALVGLASPSS